MRVALDANRYADLCRGVTIVLDAVARAERVYLPLPVLAELRAGFKVGTLGRRNEQILRRFLTAPRVRLLLPDEHTTIFYADLYAQLRAAGTPIPTHDIWIAALALQHGLTLLTRVKHFQLLPQLHCL